MAPAIRGVFFGFGHDGLNACPSNDTMNLLQRGQVARVFWTWGTRFFDARMASDIGVSSRLYHRLPHLQRRWATHQEDRSLNTCFLVVVARFACHRLRRPIAILDAPALVASRVAALIR